MYRCVLVLDSLRSFCTSPALVIVHHLLVILLPPSYLIQVHRVHRKDWVIDCRQDWPTHIDRNHAEGPQLLQ